MTDTALDKEKVLSRAKVRFLTRRDSIFLATVCSNLTTQWRKDVPFGATDGKSLILNPDTFLKLSDEEQVFLLAHETLHVAYQHMYRKGSRDHHRFNAAADYVINLELVNQGFTMIDGGLIDTKYEGMSAEEVYELLESNDNNDSNAGNALGNDIEYSDNPSDADIEQVNTILTQASIIAQQSNQAGSIPASIKRYLDELLKPKVDWKVVLRRFFHDLDKADYSWRKPKKRYLPHYLPHRKSTQLSKISIAIDTSGSISHEQFNQFISEVAAIFRFLKPKALEVIQFDWGIQSIDTVKSLDALKTIGFMGGGGTDITEVIEHVIDKPTHALVIITDGYLDTDLPTPKQPVIWVVFNNPYFIAPFGQCIHFSL